VFVGIDGFRSGWVAIGIGEGFEAARATSSFAELMEAFADAEAIGVDMPLGLTDDRDREADAAARASLKGQASSVFSAPVRAVLAAADYAEARRLSTQALGKSLSKQAFNIVPKIAEVDAYVTHPRLHEVHPELSFRVLNDGERLLGKKTWGGLHQRLALLRRAGIATPAELGPVARVGIDDVVDAAAAAWSARRVARGEARSFPEAPRQRDRSGRSICILA